MTEAKMRVLIRNPSGETCWAYCGDYTDRPSLAKAVGDFVINEYETAFLLEPDEHATVELKAEMMTDAEVAALPDM